MITIDPDRLHTLRLAAGISARDLARQVGMDTAAYTRLEREGLTDGSSVTLRQFLEIADSLGLPPGDLCTRQDTRKDHSATADLADVRTLAELLLELASRQPISALSEALGWTLERTYATADKIAEIVEPLGYVVHRRSGTIFLKPRDASHRSALLRARKHPRIYFSHRLVTPNRARLLYRAVYNPSRLRSLSSGDRTDIATLLSAGALGRDIRGGYVPSADALFALFPEGQDETSHGTAATSNW